MPESSDSITDSYKSLLKPGVILVARATLTDPNFSNSIVLLCQHGEEGAYGLVLNHPSHMPLREIFEHPPQGLGDSSTSRRVYIGGPVQATELQILQIGSDPVADSLEIAPGIYLGGAWEQVEDFLGRDPRGLRLFLGYSGWGEGQLEEEIDAGAWEVHQIDVRRLLEAPDSLWVGKREELLQFLAAPDKPSL